MHAIPSGITEATGPLSIFQFATLHKMFIENSINAPNYHCCFFVIKIPGLAQMCPL